MPIDDIKKARRQTAAMQVTPDQIPGYQTPPELQGGPSLVPPLSRGSGIAQRVAGEQAATQQVQMPGYDMVPARSVWIQRFFTGAEVKDTESQIVAEWLSEVERTGGVQGFVTTYMPGGGGGVLVLVKTRTLAID